MNRFNETRALKEEVKRLKDNNEALQSALAGPSAPRSVLGVEAPPDASSDGTAARTAGRTEAGTLVTRTGGRTHYIGPTAATQNLHEASVIVFS